MREERPPASNAAANGIWAEKAVLTGFADLEVSLKDTMARDLPRVLLAAFAMVIVVLGVSLRKVSAIALAVLVLVVEIAIVLLLSRVQRPYR